MRTSTIRQVSMAIATGATLFALTGCGSSGPTAKEDFAGDIKAMDYKLVGDVTSEKEKSSLGLAPMAFELPASSNPRKKSDSNGGSNTAPAKPQSTPTKSSKTAIKSPTPTATKTPKTYTVLEAIVNVGGCNVELERLESDTTTIKTVGKVKIQEFWVDEVNGLDTQDAPTEAPTVEAVEQYLKAKDYACFTG